METSNHEVASNFRQNAPTISSSAMLVELNISVWTGRKFDKAVSAEIDVQKQTTTRAGNYHKNLTADEPHFQAIGKYAGNARTYHYFSTMPWSDSGLRLLTTGMYFDYQNKITDIQQEFYRLVSVAVDDWDNMIARARVKLGDLFNIEDYPSKEDIMGKYRFSVKYSPVPSVGDWRVDVGNDAMQYLNECHAKAQQENIEGAYKEVWDRTYEALTSMSTKLSGDKKQIFRDTLVHNVSDMVGLLEKFNITGDETMRRAKVKLEDIMFGITPDALREDDDLRLDTKSKVDALLKEFSW
jgi:hypothetical protein